MEEFQWEHQSHEKKYRQPFGAAACGTQISLAIKAEGADKVVLRLWQHDQGESLLPMTETEKEEGLYRVQFRAPTQPGWLWYFFLVYKGETCWYYGKDGCWQGDGNQPGGHLPVNWQITVFAADSRTPDWFKQAVIYQIFPDRFYNGEPDGLAGPVPEGGTLHESWDEIPRYIKDPETGKMKSYDFFGGNLAGVMAKLPYLQELGVTVLYFNPVFRSASNHRYDTGDYLQIDPLLGTNEQFQQLTAEAAKRGISVILDGVFSHTGEDSLYFNKYGHYPTVGAYQSQESPYYPWYRFDVWPEEYESWWGFANLPNVEENHPAYGRFIISAPDSVIAHWHKLGTRGWRLDVADELPDAFLNDFCQGVKKLDSEAVVIGEVWEDASCKKSYGNLRPYFQGRQLDSVMNYPFRTAVIEFLLFRRDAEQTVETLRALQENYPAHNFYACMNLLGSHDVERILTVLGGETADGIAQEELEQRQLDEKQYELARARLQAAVVWQMTFPGVPSVYYGDEAGMEGYRDPLNRKPYPWGREERRLREWFRKLIHLRREYDVLRTGDLQLLSVHPDILAYTREIRNGKDLFGQKRESNLALVLINRSQKEIEVRIPVNWSGMLMYDMLHREKEVGAAGGQVCLTLAPFEGKVLLGQVHTQGKCCGILLHPTSLPSPYGVGDLGSAGKRFVDFLVAAGQKIWQILPLNPPALGHCPYTALSAFAGNPLLLSLDILAEQGLLPEKDLEEARRQAINLTAGNRENLDTVRDLKEKMLRKAYSNSDFSTKDMDFQNFYIEQSYWLEDYALFRALDKQKPCIPWNHWETGLIERRQEWLAHWRYRLQAEIEFQFFLQYHFFQQWQGLKKYANGQGIELWGDMPIFVHHHSADVWAHAELFDLDEAGRPRSVAGVPPDYFSITGQRWGNPLYNWHRMRETGYRWWVERLRTLLRMTDRVRLDHFRGFDACWSIPVAEKTAVRGEWQPGPGEELFQVLEEKLGTLPLVVEDLGMITRSVERLKQRLGYPGMRVMEFWLPALAEHAGRAPGLLQDMVVYPGTHDNNTLVGWYQEEMADRPEQKAALHEFLGLPPSAAVREVAAAILRLTYECKARYAILTPQDLLCLPASARMNIPGTVAETNWAWRLTAEQMEQLEANQDKLRQQAQESGRF